MAIGAAATLFEDVAHGVVAVDPETGEILAANDAFVELLGYRESALIGADASAVTARDRSPPVTGESLREARETGSTRIAWRVETRGGDVTPVEGLLATTTRDGREVALASVHEQSGRGRWADDFERRRDRYRTLFENEDLVLWEQDYSAAREYARDLARDVDDLVEHLTENPADLVAILERVDVHEINDAALEYYGAESKEHLLANLAETMTPKTVEGLSRMWQRVLDGERYFCHECEFRPLDGGAVKHELMEMYVPESHADDYSLVFTTGTDITEQKRRRRELAAAHDARQALGETLADATSIDAFAEAVCAELTAIDDVAFARVETVGPGDATEPLAAAGAEETPAEVVELPVSHDGVTRGVLVAHLANQPTLGEDRLDDLLRESADVLGYAMGSAERRRALSADDRIELALAIETADRPLSRAVDAAGTGATVTTTVERDDGTTLCYLAVEGDPDALAAAAGETPGLERVERVDHSDLQVVTSARAPSAVVAEHGGDVVEATVEPGITTVTAWFPRARSFDPVLEALGDRYGEVHTVEYTTDPADPDTCGDPLAGLTDRQREILEAAVRAGYFERPRTLNATEMADRLGVSRQSFQEVLRAAQRNAFSGLFPPE